MRINIEGKLSSFVDYLMVQNKIENNSYIHGVLKPNIRRRIEETN